jgi:hypothetical protein
VEGHLNRLQTRKRQMCGRASLDRLQRRFVLAAYGQRPSQDRVSGRSPQCGVSVRAGRLSTGSLCLDRGRSVMEHDNGYRASAHASPKVAKSLNASIFSVIVSRSIMYPKKWTTEYVRCGRA